MSLIAESNVEVVLSASAPDDRGEAGCAEAGEGDEVQLACGLAGVAVEAEGVLGSQGADPVCLLLKASLLGEAAVEDKPPKGLGATVSAKMRG